MYDVYVIISHAFRGEMEESLDSLVAPRGQDAWGVLSAYFMARRKYFKLCELLWKQINDWHDEVSRGMVKYLADTIVSSLRQTLKFFNWKLAITWCSNSKKGKTVPNKNVHWCSCLVYLKAGLLGFSSYFCNL